MIRISKNLFCDVLVKSVAFAIALFIPIAYATGELGFVNIVSVFLITLLSVLIGRELALWMGFEKSYGFATVFEIVVGFCSLSVLQLLFTVVFSIGAIQAFFASGLLVLVYLTIRFKCFTMQESGLLDLRNSLRDVLVLISISCLVTLWCRDIIASSTEFHNTGVFYAWPDIFLHAVQVVSLQNYQGLSDGSLYLAGTKQPLYHIASYALPAFYASMSRELALYATTSFLVPAGIILMGFSVYGLGSVLGGRLVGLGATAATFLLPDASMYGLKKGFFGFQWLMQVSPGSGTAMALVICALSIYVVGVRNGRFNYIILSGCLILMAAFFRVHITVPSAIMILILGLMTWKPLKIWHKSLFFVFLFFSAAFIILLFESIELAPHFLTGEYAAPKFFNLIHESVRSSPYANTAIGGVYIALIDNSPLLFSWVVGYVIFILSAIGLIFPLMLILGGIKKIFFKQEGKVDIVPLILIFSCFLIIVILPLPIDGDISNFSHRPFVLIYAVCLTFLIYWVFIAFGRFFLGNKKRRLMSSSLVIPLLLVGVMTPWTYGKGIQQPSNVGEIISNTPMPAGLFKASQYIRNNSEITDVVLNSKMDQYAAVVSLSERQAYISRNLLYSDYEGEYGDIFRSRRVEIQRLPTILTFTELYEFASKRNIQWLLKHPSDFVDWEHKLLNCSVYENNGFRVYDLRDSKCRR